jgi:thioredoxin-like negative regulator of GroEL
MDWVSVLIATFIVVFLLFNLLPLWRAWRARGRSVPELDALLNDAQRRAPRLLVYFWSPSCGPCRAMTPVIDRLAVERGTVVKIDISAAAALARHFGVMATPSLAVVEQGRVRKLLVGTRSELQLRALLES